ncbi:hypothetical protein E2C01_021542 [Portunus trituberculatus]|uniref:Uncharacterized protein n=1 Tax=Portunus trituberculatus TaxID=210409 RepID=A0A5B7E300_PORTR|nr:hypothetical protein [Portunus trituberculatus]
MLIELVLCSVSIIATVGLLHVVFEQLVRRLSQFYQASLCHLPQCFGGAGWVRGGKARVIHRPRQQRWASIRVATFSGRSRREEEAVMKPATPSVEGGSAGRPHTDPCLKAQFRPPLTGEDEGLSRPRTRYIERSQGIISNTYLDMDIFAQDNFVLVKVFRAMDDEQHECNYVAGRPVTMAAGCCSSVAHPYRVFLHASKEHELTSRKEAE